MIKIDSNLKFNIFDFKVNFDLFFFFNTNDSSSTLFHVPATIYNESNKNWCTKHFTFLSQINQFQTETQMPCTNFT